MLFKTIGQAHLRPLLATPTTLSLARAPSCITRSQSSWDTKEPNDRWNRRGSTSAKRTGAYGDRVRSTERSTSSRDSTSSDSLSWSSAWSEPSYSPEQSSYSSDRPRYHASDRPDYKSSYNRSEETRVDRSGNVRPNRNSKTSSDGSFLTMAERYPAKPLTEREIQVRADMRVKRAERLERKDLTAQLTETKTYMGGFTQPRHLAFLNTLDPTRKDKDSYEVRVGANRVRPAPEAYEPHTVFLAVSRYPIKWPPGRAIRRECFSGFCKESEMATKFAGLNYGFVERDAEADPREVRKVALDPRQEPAGTVWACSSASKEYIDLAVWPDSPEQRSRDNKAYYQVKKSNLKAEKARKKAVEEAAVSGAEIPAEDLDSGDIPLPPFRDPVVGWERPSPPFLDTRLIVPLMTITLPTRPLAATLARLCNSFARGLPFVASVPNHDRKDGPDFFRRLLRMRANRIRELTENIVEKLDGNGGGFFGLRLDSEQKGRGVEGESLGDDVERPNDGWAQLRWLEADSPLWEGIERDAFIESWKDVDGVGAGLPLTETGTSVESVAAPRSQERSEFFLTPVESQEQPSAKA